MLHVADNHGEADDHLPPGKGDIDWPRVLADLTRISFSGALILEMSGHGAGDAQERLRDAQEARAFLQNLNEKKDGCNS